MDKVSNQKKRKMDLLVLGSSGGDQDEFGKKTVCDDATVVFKMCEVTKNSLKVSFGASKKVVYANVVDKNFPPSFIVRAILEDHLGHSSFAVADHYVPGVVVVAFESEDDAYAVTDQNFKWGASLASFKKIDVITRANPDCSRLYKAETFPLSTEE